MYKSVIGASIDSTDAQIRFKSDKTNRALTDGRLFAALSTCVSVCERVHVLSVICTHTYVSQPLHPAAPLSCCHGELTLAYSECIGECECACVCTRAA